MQQNIKKRLMYNLKELGKIITNKISGLEFSNNPAGLYEPVKYILGTSGKRIRPVLLLAGCNVFSDDINSALNPAVAFEIFHNFTLLHDDVMDNSPLRRNKPTVHLKWNINTAILSGDVMMIKAYDYIMKTPKKFREEILILFGKTASEVMEGQQYDMNFENRNDVSVAEYLEMIRLKTSVLIAGCTKTGAITGGANKKDTDLIYNFGLNIGLAFQLQDDLLDVYGNIKKFGKQIGGDIIESKKTFLLINALEKAEKDNNPNLKKIIFNKNINNKEKIKKVTEIYNFYEIKKLTEKKINEFHENAMKSLYHLGANKNRKFILENFTEKIMKRDY